MLKLSTRAFAGPAVVKWKLYFLTLYSFVSLGQMVALAILYWAETLSKWVERRISAVTGLIYARNRPNMKWA